ncbi:MAG: hypothetical protein U9N60_02955 [Thermodesulfobacteriota bacterium]|nr:hypothetical protein [Thermodesulfobacteriota bacterium]
MDRYRVENVMSGSMGKVYISEHLGWGIKMAIKSPRREVLADREGFKRILTEANNWVRMGMHPNVAACYYVLALEINDTLPEAVHNMFLHKVTPVR